MTSVRRVYRARAYYGEPGSPRFNVITRHFQTKRARDRWAAWRLEGRPAVEGMTWEDEGVPRLPPADRVEVADSDPVTFPEE